jgi:hypothetical protein
MEAPHAAEIETCTEVRSGVEASKARPLTDAARVRLAEYVRPDMYVVIEDDTRKLAAEIVVLAGRRRLYDSVVDNVDYWVKDP